MDFSQAQEKAHKIEFAEALINRKRSTYDALDSSIRQQTIDAERLLFMEEAARYRRGCDVHFMRSATRIKRSGALVPVPEIPLFEEFCQLALGSSTTRSQFDDIVDRVESILPRLHGWLEWWLRPRIRSMAFPSQSEVDPDLLEDTPNNTNPVETQHSLLHHAGGTHHDLVPGVKHLHLHVKEMEKHTGAIEGQSYYARSLKI